MIRPQVLYTNEKAEFSLNFLTQGGFGPPFLRNHGPGHDYETNPERHKGVQA